MSLEKVGFPEAAWSFEGHKLGHIIIDRREGLLVVIKQKLA
jgi:hypothetical protein